MKRSDLSIGVRVKIDKGSVLWHNNKTAYVCREGLVSGEPIKEGEGISTTYKVEIELDSGMKVTVPITRIRSGDQ